MVTERERAKQVRERGTVGEIISMLRVPTAAGILHGLMRSADVIEVGCQSMLVGNRWDIHAIHADREGS